MKRAPAWFALPGLAVVSALALTLASAAGNAGTGLNYIVPVAAGSVEDPSLRPAMPANLTIADGTNMPLPLAHFRGEVLLLNFWATWCAPCLKEMPFLDRLQGDLKGQPLQILAISEDKGGMPVAKAFMQRTKLTFLRPFTDPGGAAAQLLNVQGLPTSFIVDRQGRLVQRVEGPFEWDNPTIVARFRDLMKEAP